MIASEPIRAAQSLGWNREATEFDEISDVVIRQPSEDTDTKTGDETKKKGDALEAYCINLNKKAREGRIDPLLGRYFLPSSSTDSARVVEICTGIHLFWRANAFWPFPFAAE